MQHGKTMKIIFSRKGFDSSSGGCPSPILPDGRMISLPIPDKNSPVKYEDIECSGHNLGVIVSSLTRGKVKPGHFAHLDPDLRNECPERKTGWLPVLGQTGSAQGHLRNQNIQCGDVFLFYGLFRDSVKKVDVYAWEPGTTAKHVIWGWMEIDRILPVADLSVEERDIYENHPHLTGNRGANNTLYIGRKSGVFSHYSEKLQLTLPDSPKPRMWRLPVWMYPEGGKTPLTYHSNLDRWVEREGHSLLQSASRGQEFVLDCADYPDSVAWLNGLI